MSTYVPPFLKEKSKYQELVNTSLPAKEAPTLKPATLASLTSVKDAVSSATKAFSNMQFEKRAAYQPLTKSNLPTEDDFPSLGSKKPTIAPKVATTSFASLSREWAKKQEEDNIAAKEAAEKEKIRQQVDRMTREKEEKEFKEFRNRTIALPSRKRTNDNDTRKLDIGCYESDISEEEYESPPEYEPEEEEAEEEEEEEQREYNAHWGERW